jgi:uncharacterized protein
MSDLYNDYHQSFQDEHNTRRLADRLEALAHVELETPDREFIESAAMFFLATVDDRGRPTVSYKGGAPGFVRVLSPRQLLFPVYDGNGMFLSLGNITCMHNVGLLFIDFESARRLRVQGTAKVIASDQWQDHYPGAQHLVEVTTDKVFVNCGRYIHKVETKSLSAHLPDAQGRQPFPAWKRLDLFSDSLPAGDQDRVRQAGGSIGLEAYRGEQLPDGSVRVK